VLMLFGFVFGIANWIDSAKSGTVASAGTVMLSALPIIVGLQMLLSAMNFDMQNVPRRPLHLDLKSSNQRRAKEGAKDAKSIGWDESGSTTLTPNHLVGAASEQGRRQR
jgi:hypothetical protein